MSEYADIPVEEQKKALRHSVIDAPQRYRIVFAGNFFQGPTGIVASLHRALEGLGHTVFKLDTAVHRSVLDRSSGAKGGYGPVWFRPREIEPILQRFRPDMIVLCAGGMVLAPEDGEYLRSAGVLSVGLTLSDPDVQQSVIEHIGTFDLHTTNAELSYDRYLGAGHTNTFLFPFGIDRSFILRDVADAPDLAADAIAIGHAQGRPDRHEIMVPLAERLTVRTYGSGWPIPGSEPVSGDRLLQAAKAGAVHVNFPATRAGFTNVKCGVFETIGAGAVLATTEFGEMARLFEYGTEIIGYRGAADLADQIEALIADPEALEAMRRRSFHRLIAEHLYERRWNTLFTQAQSSLADERHGERADLMGEVLHRSGSRPRNVLISGYYGARNRGDDILLDALRERITSEVPDANIIAAAVNAKEVEQSQGIQAFRRTDPYESDKHASSATSLILGPGGLWHDYTIQRAGGVAGIVSGASVSPSHLVQLPLMVRAHGGTFHVHGMGVGPLTDTAAKSAIHLAGLLAESVTIRDQTSADLLEGATAGWPAQVLVSPDVAYTLPLADLDSVASHHLPDRPYIAVNVRPFQGNDDDLVRIRDTVLAIARRHDLAVLGIPMQPVDTEAFAAWRDVEGSVHFDVLPPSTPYEVFLRALHDARAVVSMRLHTNLFAHRLGKAPVGIEYDPKLLGHFTQLGRERYCVPMPVDGSLLEDRLLETLEAGGLDERGQEAVRALEDEADRTLSALCAALAAAPKKLPDTGAMVQAPPKVEKRRRAKGAWPDEQDVDLRNASVRGGNDEDPGRMVDVVRRTGAAGDMFHIDHRSPKRGDFAEWTLQVPVPSGGDGVRIELWIHQRYPEKSVFAGRLGYEVTVDGDPLLHEDVTGWSERNTVWIAKRTSEASVTVRLRLSALRDTEDWGWGKATATTVQAVRAQPWTATADLQWGASSPASVPVLPPSPKDEDPSVHLPVVPLRGGETPGRREAGGRPTSAPEPSRPVVAPTTAAPPRVTSTRTTTTGAVPTARRPWWHRG